MKYKKILAMMLLICIIWVNLPVKRANAQVQLIVPFIEDLLIASGVNVASNLLLEHVARDLFYNKGLALEGGLSQLTVEEVINKGYIPPEGTNKVYRLSKAALLGSIISSILGIGTSYLVDYYTTDDVPEAPGISIVSGSSVRLDSSTYDMKLFGSTSYFKTAFDIPIEAGHVYTVIMRSNNAGKSGIAMALWFGSYWYGLNVSKPSYSWVDNGLYYWKVKVITTTNGINVYGWDGSSYSQLLSSSNWSSSWTRALFGPQLNTSADSGSYVEMFFNAGDSDPIIGGGEKHVTGTVDINKTTQQVDLAPLAESQNANKVVYVYVNDNGTPDTIDDKVSYQTGESDSLPDVTTPDTNTGLLRTMVSLFTEGLIGDISTINFDRLKVPITDKFPFSLPWDVKNAVSGLVSNGELKPLDLQFYGKDNPISFTAEWPEFVVILAPFVRGGLLFIYCLGLIWGTSKLIGGGQ